MTTSALLIYPLLATTYLHVYGLLHIFLSLFPLEPTSNLELQSMPMNPYFFLNYAFSLNPRTKSRSSLYKQPIDWRYGDNKRAGVSSG